MHKHVVMHLAVICQRNRFVQIWRCDADSSTNSVQKLELAFLLDAASTTQPHASAANHEDAVHVDDHDAIASEMPVLFSWLPVSIHETHQLPLYASSSRIADCINVAAIAYQNGCVDLVLVPNMRTENGSTHLRSENVIQIGNGTRIHVTQPTPIARLRVTSMRDTPTCMRWCEAQPNVIAIGFESGLVALFNLDQLVSASASNYNSMPNFSNVSNLSNSDLPSSQFAYLQPRKIFRAHCAAVRTLAFSPFDARHIVTSSIARHCFVWDTHDDVDMPIVPFRLKTGSVCVSYNAIFAVAWIFRPIFKLASRFSRTTEQKVPRAPSQSTFAYYNSLLFGNEGNVAAETESLVEGESHQENKLPQAGPADNARENSPHKSNALQKRARICTSRKLARVNGELNE